MEKFKDKNNLKVLGLMSGTSLDGLDICLVDISNDNGKIDSRIIKFESFEYSTEFKEYLATLFQTNTSEICKANFNISHEWSKLIQKFLTKHSIEEFDLIASHGQTIWHEHGQSSLQIGEPSVLAYDFSIPCIADFRVMDIAAGGSGAPLVPFIDYLWFKEAQKNILLLNIGGIANFTIIPQGCKSVNDIHALDTGPGNGLIDSAIALATHCKIKYDKDGEWAKKGKIRNDLLDELLAHDYFSKPLPKSTGKEMFGENYVKTIIEKYKINSINEFEDLIATLTFFTAKSIHLGYSENYSENFPIDEIVVSGGGAFNPVLMQHLEQLFSNVDFVPAEKYGIDPESKEAYAFAILGALRVWEIPANVPKVTGAKKHVLLGKIIY